MIDDLTLDDRNLQNFAAAIPYNRKVYIMG